MKKEKTNPLLSAPIKSLLRKFAIPCVLSLLVNALYNIVDQVFIGHSDAGTAGNMATTLVFPFITLALAVALLTGDGAAALYSISMGEKDEKRAKKSVSTALGVLLIVGIILAIAGFFLRRQFLDLLGAEGYSDECRNFAQQYMGIIAAGLPFFILTCGSASLIRATGSPAYSMKATVVGAIINLILDPIMIFALNLGVRGAALATIIGQITSAILCVRYFIKRREGEVFELIKIDRAMMAKIAKLGISSFVTQISIATISIVANIVIGQIGGEQSTDAGGALGIVFKVFAIIISFCVGISVGGQPIVGFNYGAKRYDRVLQTYRYIIFANIVVGLAGTILFELFPDIIVKVFGDKAMDLEFYRGFAARAFRVYLGGILLCCLQKASCIFLQSINRPIHAMILSITRDVVLLVPMVIIFGYSWGLNGMLWAGIVADSVAFLLTVFVAGREYKKLANA